LKKDFKISKQMPTCTYKDKKELKRLKKEVRYLKSALRTPGGYLSIFSTLDPEVEELLFKNTRRIEILKDSIS